MNQVTIRSLDTVSGRATGVQIRLGTAQDVVSGFMPYSIFRYCTFGTKIYQMWCSKMLQGWARYTLVLHAEATAASYGQFLRNCARVPADMLFWCCADESVSSKQVPTTGRSWKKDILKINYGRQTLGKLWWNNDKHDNTWWDMAFQDLPRTCSRQVRSETQVEADRGTRELWKLCLWSRKPEA